MTAVVGYVRVSTADSCPWCGDDQVWAWDGFAVCPRCSGTRGNGCASPGTLDDWITGFYTRYRFACEGKGGP